MVIKELTEIQKYESFGKVGKILYAIYIAHQSFITLIFLILSILLPSLAFGLGWQEPSTTFLIIIPWFIVAFLQTTAIMLDPKKWLLSELLD